MILGASRRRFNGSAIAKAIKLKLDGDLDRSTGKESRVVREARPDAWIGVDANQGFVAADLDALAAAARDYSVSLIEQPLKRGDEAGAGGVAAGSPRRRR